MHDHAVVQFRMTKFCCVATNPRDDFAKVRLPNWERPCRCLQWRHEPLPCPLGRGRPNAYSTAQPALCVAHELLVACVIVCNDLEHRTAIALVGAFLVRLGHAVEPERGVTDKQDLLSIIPTGTMRSEAECPRLSSNSHTVASTRTMGKGPCKYVHSLVQVFLLATAYTTVRMELKLNDQFLFTGPRTMRCNTIRLCWPQPHQFNESAEFTVASSVHQSQSCPMGKGPWACRIPCSRQFLSRGIHGPRWSTRSVPLW